MTNSPLKALSLFSSGGIGDLALRSAGVQTIVANELLPDRAALFEHNFPDCEMVVGDIRSVKSEILQAVRQKLDGACLDILFATPPCQGMSKNGRGKLLNGIRAGLKPELDIRNQLIVDVVEIALALKPMTIVLENVPEMENTVIEGPDGSYFAILEYLSRALAPDYVGSAKVVEFADYGIPQRRQRLITVFSRSKPLVLSLSNRSTGWLPQPTHARIPTLLQKPWITVVDAIGHLQPLDAANSASAKSSIPFHRVPVLDEAKYFWVSNTPPSRSAFDNQCVNADCGFQENLTHGTSRRSDGINRANEATPLRCAQCNSLLPRPWVERDGQHFLMSGFTSAYKRMRGDLPASALTRNLSYACSDQKLHPTQNRVLSLLEAFIVHSISEYEYRWSRNDGRKVSDKTIREIIGESIPPKGLEILFRHFIPLMVADAAQQLQLAKSA